MGNENPSDIPNSVSQAPEGIFQDLKRPVGLDACINKGYWLLIDKVYVSGFYGEGDWKLYSVNLVTVLFHCSAL